MYSIGITQIRFVINPLTESSATPLVNIPSEHLLYVSASGMVFQFIFFLLLGLVLWRTRSVSMTPLLICVPFSLLNIGSYLLMGQSIGGNDVTLMIDAGLPVWIIYLIGSLITVSGFFAFMRILSQLGLKSSDPFKEIALPVFLNFGVYASAMTIYGYFSGYGTMIGLINLVLTPILTLGFTLVFRRFGPSEHLLEYSKSTGFKILGLGLASVALCLIIF
ncbi:MAG: hypothetical protein NWF07_15705 [Candidatus Bathyarchaeota archaeon]|nr:hypothetical protein [Candidatus Bathyarchaeota archaeon]